VDGVVRPQINGRGSVDEGVPDIRRDDRVSKRGCVGCLLLMLAGAGGVIAFVYFQFHPRDRIAVTIKNAPAETRFLCIVTETDEGIRAMNWSPSMVVPFEMEPRQCTISYVMHDGPTITNRFVVWRFGSRYGVVTRQPEKVWRVHWFQAENVPLEGRSFLFGEGAATFDILKARTEQLPAEAVRELGFEDLRWDDEK
jgi:hypothetical protein